MALIEGDPWEEFVGSIGSLRSNIAKSRAVNVNSAALRDEVRSAAQIYFRTIRNHLKSLSIDTSLLSGIDEAMQSLFVLSRGLNAKKSFMSILNTAHGLLKAIALEREFKFAEFEQPNVRQMNQHELLIMNSIEKLVPSAARSYHQAISDLSDEARISYRGAANELREALREVLDYLAPDKDVMAADGFTLESGQTRPTRAQKAKFVLGARGMPNNAIKAPQELIELIETQVSIVISAAFGRTNISSHIQTERQEVLRVKQYADIVLSELLAIPPPS